MFLQISVVTQRWLLDLLARLPRVARADSGQSTVEYALVLLGAAAVALLLVAWATKSNRVGALLDLVFDQLTDRAKA